MNKLRSYFSSAPIRRAWLFGSFSKGTETADSDIDLLVEFVPNKRIGLSYFKMIAELEELCSRKVDLVETGMLDYRVAPIVENEKVLIYERAN